MEEQKIVKLKKDELGIREYVKSRLGKGRISDVIIEYTPVGEKIIVRTNKPGLVIGRRGEKINELSEVLKKRFELENPHIEIQDIAKPEFDSQLIADEIALNLERKGNLKFKVIAYKALERIIKAGALGVEIRLSGRLPSERAKSWRFASGYLKKTGDTAKIVSRAKAIAQTTLGVIGVKVAILSPDVKIHDQINVNEEMRQKIRQAEFELTNEENKKIEVETEKIEKKKELVLKKKTAEKKKEAKQEKQNKKTGEKK